MHNAPSPIRTPMTTRAPNGALFRNSIRSNIVFLGDKFFEKFVHVRDAVGILPIPSPVGRLKQLVVLRLRGVCQNPDATAIAFPDRPLDALGLRETILRRILNVDPTLTPFAMMTVKIGDAQLKGVTDHTFDKPLPIS